MFTHLFPSGLTNGLIIQLSPWNVISDFFGEGIPFWNISTQSERRGGGGLKEELF